MKKLKKERKTEILHKIKLPLFKSFLFDGYVNSFFSIQTKFCFYENHHQIRKGVMRQLFNYPFKPYHFYLFCSCQLLGYISPQKKIHLTFLKEGNAFYIYLVTMKNEINKDINVKKIKLVIFPWPLIYKSQIKSFWERSVD